MNDAERPSTPFSVRAMKERSGPHPVVPASGRREGWLALAVGVLLATSVLLAVLWTRERAARTRAEARAAALERGPAGTSAEVAAPGRP